jgi:SNF2 family DNA or RNA helicase
MSLVNHLAKIAAPKAAPISKKEPEKKPHGTGIPSMKEWFAPYDHQKKAIDRLYKNRGKMLLAHEMGTGKTVTSIYGFEKLKHEGKATKALVIVPSGLRANFAKNGIEKFTTSDYQVIGSSSEKSKDKRYVRPKEEGDSTYTIVSYAMFRRDPIGIMQRTGADTIIADEFHKTRNERASTYKALLAARPMAVNFMGLTASMINNDPAEIATLLTLSEGKRTMSPQEFRKRYTRTIGFTKGFAGGKKKVKGFKNIEELKARTQPKIDYVETGDLKGKTMPKKNVQNVDVPMSDEQYQLYQLALDRLGALKERVVRADPNVSVKDANFLFAQISQARQVANSLHTGRKDVDPTQSANKTPKIRKILDDTESHLKETSDGKVVLYSNLIRGGVDVLSAGLKARGIDHAVFVGKGTEIGGTKITSVVRQKGVEDYKAGKKKVIVLSGAGAEGLDLKDSTAFYALDGHFNPQRILQAEARARRLGGQKHRLPENRTVDVRRYRSIAPASAKPGWLGRAMGKKTPFTTDEWMYSVAGGKHSRQKSFYKAFREPSKYLYKYKDKSGNTRYVYPKKQKSPGMFSRVKSFFGGGKKNEPQQQPKPVQPLASGAAATQLAIGK